MSCSSSHKKYKAKQKLVCVCKVSEIWKLFKKKNDPDSLSMLLYTFTQVNLKKEKLQTGKYFSSFQQAAHSRSSFLLIPSLQM